MLTKSRIHVPVGSDGMARIGRTINDLRGLRFEDGEENAETNVEGDAPEAPATHDEDVCAAKIADLTAALAAKEAENAALVTEITTVKAALYDVQMQVPSEDAADGEQGSDVADFIPNTTTDDPIDALFA